MSGLLDRAEIDIPCTNCGRKTKKAIGWLKMNRQFRCMCGTDIHLDTSQFRSEIAKVDGAHASLLRSLKKFGQ